MKLNKNQIAIACFFKVNTILSKTNISQELAEVFIQVLDETDELYYDSDDYQLVRANNSNIEEYDLEQQFGALELLTKYRILLVILTSFSRHFGQMEYDDQRKVNWYNLGSCNGVDMDAWKKWQRDR
jgi:hypothetical protein